MITGTLNKIRKHSSSCRYFFSILPISTFDEKAYACVNWLYSAANPRAFWFNPRCGRVVWSMFPFIFPNPKMYTLYVLTLNKKIMIIIINDRFIVQIIILVTPPGGGGCGRGTEAVSFHGVVENLALLWNTNSISITAEENDCFLYVITILALDLFLEILLCWAEVFRDSYSQFPNPLNTNT